MNINPQRPELFFYMCIYSTSPPCLGNIHKANFFPFQNWLSLPRVIQEIMFGLSSSPVSGRLHRFHTHLMLRTGDKYCIFIQSTLIQSISWQFLLHPCTCAAIAPLPPNICLGTLASFFPTASAHHQSHYFHTSWWQSKRLRVDKASRDE